MLQLRKLLFPFSLIYDAVTSIRNWLYDTSIITPYQSTIPVICVGNLNVGGTGKTPMIEYLIRLLGDKKLAVLSRGYKRSSKGFMLLDATIDATIVGDEPYQFYAKFPDIKVAVCESRVTGVQKLQSLFDLDVILLDDAFQHRSIKPSFSILLTAYNDLFINDLLLPAGNLRESKNGVKRSDVVVVTKCPYDVQEVELQEIKSTLNKYQKPVFFTKITYTSFVKGESEIILNELTNYQILLVTGIANPVPFVEFLNKKSIRFEHLAFADHHYFTENDINELNSRFEKLNATKKLILTTEKDYVRLQNKIQHLYYLPIETSFIHQNEQENFNQLIKKQF